MSRGQLTTEARRTAARLRDRWVFDVVGSRSREWRGILSQRRDHLVAIDQPVVLISQVQRSGGTLLAQLFDAHPGVHAHPDELYVGYPDKRIWPSIDPSSTPRSLYRTLREVPAQRAFARGYTKYGKGADESAASHPFVLAPVLQRALFEELAAGATSSRSVFDSYFTSYFNAWLDNANLYQAPKRWITGFVPRLAMAGDSLERFFAVYPDGRLITIIRDPESWLVSARRHHDTYGDMGRALLHWRRSATTALTASGRWPEQVLVLRFEELVDQTEDVMRRTATWLGLDWNPVLTDPTFNGRPIEADSSFPVDGYGIRKETISRAGSLTTAERRRVAELVGDVRDQANEALGDVSVG